MSLIIRDPSSPPSTGWQYPHPVAGRMISTFNFNLLYPRIVETYTANQMLVPGEQEVVDYICRELYVGCYESETRQPLINKFSLGLPQPTAKGCCSSAPLPIREESL